MGICFARECEGRSGASSEAAPIELFQVVRAEGPNLVEGHAASDLAHLLREQAPHSRIRNPRINPAQFLAHAHTHTRARARMPTHTCTRRRTHTCTRTRSCAHTYAHAQADADVHARARAHARTCAHTYTETADSDLRISHLRFKVYIESLHGRCDQCMVHEGAVSPRLHYLEQFPRALVQVYAPMCAGSVGV
jgi:hypothetical protein